MIALRGRSMSTVFSESFARLLPSRLGMSSIVKAGPLKSNDAPF
jgi:hypothetical protein